MPLIFWKNLLFLDLQGIVGNMKKQAIIIGVLAVVVILGVYCFVATKNKKIPAVETPVVVDTAPVSVPVEQSGKIDEHLTINNELRDVNFCGKTYKVKQVMIDGVDVVQRVAELATNDLMPAILDRGPLVSEEERSKGKMILKEGELAKAICGNVQSNRLLGEIIETEVKEKFSGVDVGIKEEIYPVSSEQAFYVAVPSGSIYADDGFSGTFIGPIGTLK